jgi:hypothetical protein
MYASCRMYRLGAGSMDDAMRKVDVDLAEEFGGMPGFVSYHVLATTDGEICSWTVFADEEGARRASEAARKFVDERMSEFRLERIGSMTGEVMVGRAREQILEPAHH